MTKYAPFSEHESKDRAHKYTLYGISHHSGTLNGGHYIGQVMNIDDANWYTCNDSLCSKARGPDCVSSSSAYLLFYIQGTYPKQ